MKSFFPQRLARWRGFSLMDVTSAVFVSTVAIAGAGAWRSADWENQDAAILASYHKQVVGAAATFVYHMRILNIQGLGVGAQQAPQNSPGQTGSGFLKGTTKTWRMRVTDFINPSSALLTNGIASSDGTIPANTPNPLQNWPFLPTFFDSSNAFGQEPCVLVAGNNGNLEVLIISTTATSINRGIKKSALNYLAQLAGSTAGTLIKEADGKTYATSTSGNWRFDLATSQFAGEFASQCPGGDPLVTQDVGQIVSFLTLSSDNTGSVATVWAEQTAQNVTMLDNGEMMRTPYQERVETTQMQVKLDMGGNNIMDGKTVLMKAQGSAPATLAAFTAPVITANVGGSITQANAPTLLTVDGKASLSGSLESKGPAKVVTGPVQVSQVLTTAKAGEANRDLQFLTNAEGHNFWDICTKGQLAFENAPTRRVLQCLKQYDDVWRFSYAFINNHYSANYLPRNKKFLFRYYEQDGPTNIPAGYLRTQRTGQDMGNPANPTTAASAPWVTEEGVAFVSNVGIDCGAAGAIRLLLPDKFFNSSVFVNGVLTAAVGGYVTTPLGSMNQMGYAGSYGVSSCVNNTPAINMNMLAGGVVMRWIVN